MIMLQTYSDCRDFLESILKSLVEYPNDLVVKQDKQDEAVIFLISAKKTDMGRVVGRNGQIIKALKAVFSAAKSDSLVCDIVLEEDKEDS